MADRFEGLIVVLTGGNGIAMTACFGLPQNDLLSGRAGDREEHHEALSGQTLSCMVGAVLIALLLGPAVAQAQAAPWTVVPSPSPGSENELNGVASVSANDVWAVGDTDLQTLTEHWNGTSWSIVSSPAAGQLRGIAIVSANDIWAAGEFTDPNTGTTTTVIEQWNGTAWSVVTSPNPSASDNNLNAAAADPASGQAWAVGEFFSSISNGLQTLTEFNL